MKKMLTATIMVVASFLVFALGASAAPNEPQNAVAAAYDPKPGYYQWRTVGRNPMWTSRDGRKGVSNPEDFIEMMTSAKGKTCAELSGLPASVWAKATLKVRQGDYTRFSARPGTTYRSMCFGVGDVSVIKRVQWAGSGQLRGRRIIVEHGGLRFEISVPDGCANVTVNITRAPPQPQPPPTTTPKPPGKVKILIRKQALTAAAEEQILYPTPTGIFRFKVQCGASGKPRFIVYQNDPQAAGSCPVSAGRVRIWELITLGPDKWQPLSPVYQTFKLKGKKRVLAVFKNKQVKKEAPKPPPPPTPQPPPPPTPPSKGRVVLIKHAFVDNVKVATPSGFGFTVNGSGFSNSGETTAVGEFNANASVTVCETNPMGWTPDKNCETQTVPAGGTVTFVFANRKTTPPPPQVTYNVGCSAATVKIKDITWVATGSASNGAVMVNAHWTFSPDGASQSGTTVTTTHGQYNTVYTATVTVVFSDGATRTTTCSARTEGQAPPPPP